ncbi:MAG: DUF547 domain-containing protein [Pseudomonadota bacterium]
MSMIDRRSFLTAGLAVAVIGAHGPAAAAPKSRLISGPWQQFGAGGDPDHSALGAFLNSYRVVGSDGVARLKYGQAVQDGARLDGYLAALQSVDPTSLARPAAMAYWFNLYNALTIDLVLQEFPVDSIKKVRGGLFNTGPWTDKLVTVAGQELSLDDIEHGILRPVWQDARIHYAVNCAAVGCPDLDAKPFLAGDLEQRLDASARRFAEHPRGARATSDGAVLSSIFDWFAEDFGPNEDAVLAHVNEYRGAAIPGPVDDYRYDWGLNAA